MVVIASYELTSLAAAVICAAMAGALYDIFRGIIKYTKRAVFFDALLWICEGVMCAFVWQRYMHGEIRAYMIVGAVLGGILYYFLLSRYVFWISEHLTKEICGFFNIILKFLLTPVKFLCKILNIYSKRAYIKIFRKVEDENDEKKA